jgi:hypothetical protein
MLPALQAGIFQIALSYSRTNIFERSVAGVNRAFSATPRLAGPVGHLQLSFTYPFHAPMRDIGSALNRLPACLTLSAFSRPIRSIQSFRIEGIVRAI